MDIPDVLDLVPDRQELLQFHQEEGINLAGKGELRNQWCALGMENEVPECKPLGKFNSIKVIIKSCLSYFRYNFFLFLFLYFSYLLTISLATFIPRDF